MEEIFRYSSEPSTEDIQRSLCQTIIKIYCYTSQLKYVF